MSSLAVRIPFPSIISYKRLSSLFACLATNQALQVLTVLGVLVQATQHTDDTLLQAYLLPMLFRVLHQAQALPFPYTIIPRGYCLHGAPTLMTIFLGGVNVCRKKYN